MDSPTKCFEDVAGDVAVTVNPLVRATPKTTYTSSKQPLTFATVTADILRTQGVSMAYKLFGLNPPGGGVDPTSMFSGMLLGRLSSNSGAGTDHLHGLLMLALQTLESLACRARAHHSDVSAATLHHLKCKPRRVLLRTFSDGFDVSNSNDTVDCACQAVALVSWILSVVTAKPVARAVIGKLLKRLACTHRVGSQSLFCCNHHSGACDPHK